MRKALAILMAVIFTFAVTDFAVNAQQALPQGYTDNSRGFGLYSAAVYNTWKAVVVNGNLSTGAQTVQVQYGQYALSDGTLITPFNVNAPITIGLGANQETVTPSAVSGCNLGAGNPLPSLCNVTATFANTHGQGEPIFSGTSGLQEAINDAFLKGGGLVSVDKAFGGSSVTIAAAVPYWNVSIVDTRGSSATYWNPLGGAATLAAPTTLVAGTAGFGVNGANFTGGAYTGSNTYITCIAYVDIMGQEGPCSATFTVAT